MAALQRTPPYKTFAIAEDGARTRIEAHEIVLERPAGIDLELNLAPPPAFRGLVAFSTFRGRGLLIKPGASNLAYIFVEDRIGDRPRKTSRRDSQGRLGHLYLVDSRGRKQPTADRTFVVQLAPRRELLVEFCPRAPWARYVEISTTKPELSIHLNAGNIVQFRAED